jgi:anti-sigma B factor antagonist
VNIDIEDREGALLLTPHIGRLDAVAAPSFRAATLHHAAGRSLVVVILDKVAALDSTGLGCLVALIKAVAAGGHVRLVGVSESIQALLRVTRLDSVLRTYPDVGAALA